MTHRTTFRPPGSGAELYTVDATVTVPPGTANTITVLTASAKFLAFSIGSGMGDFFADVDRTASRESSLDELLPVLGELTARHGVTFAGEPVPS